MYAYTYDDADNLLTKVTPFEDDFNDEDLTGWSLNGTWSASNGNADTTVTGSWRSLNLTATDSDMEIFCSYRMDDTYVTVFGNFR